jgi:hypothetical protein
MKPQRKSLKDKKALKLKVYQAALQTSSDDNEDKGSNYDDQDSHSTSSKESTDSNTSA